MKIGDTITTYRVDEGVVVPLQGNILTMSENQAEIAFDDGSCEPVSLDSITLADQCVACSTPVVESAKFCGACGLEHGKWVESLKDRAQAPQGEGLPIQLLREAAARTVVGRKTATQVATS